MSQGSNKGPGFLTTSYLTALLAPVVVASAMQVTWPFFETNPVLPFLLAVVFCAWYGGLGPGLLSVSVSFLLSDLVFGEPYSHFHFHKRSDLVQLLLFVVIGATISLLSELMRRERRQCRINLDALLASEERYRKLADNFPNGAVITYDKNFRVTFIAGGGLKKADVSADFFVGKLLSEIAPPEVVALVEPHFGTAFRGQSVTYECPYPNGRTYFSAVAPLLNGNGLIKEILVISQDITELKQAEQALLATETKFRRLLDSSIIGVVFWNLQGGILAANDLFLSMTGYTREDLLLGQVNWNNLTPPEYTGVDERAVSQLRATGACTPFEKEYFRKDGSRVSVLIGSALLEGEKDTGSSFVMDITERKLSEEALREAERKYRSIFENAVEGIFQTTPDGRFIAANPALARMLGFDSPEELMSARTNVAREQYVDPKAREEFNRSMAENGFVFDFEFEAYRKDRCKIWISENVRAVRDEHGALLYHEGTSEDITDRKRAETRSTAFANLAHKLSGAWTPLTAGRIIAETADQLFGWDSCTLDLYDAEHDVIQSMLNMDMIGGQRVSLTPLAERRPPTPKCRRVIDQGPELIIREDPLEFDEDAIPIGDTARPSAVLMSAPIRHASRVIGILSFQSYTPRAYDHVAFSDLQALSDHCGEALNRLQAENQLQESEERYRDLVENSHDLICTHDLDGLILSANRAALEIIGYPSVTYAGDTNLREILPPDGRDQFNDYLQRICADGVASGLMLVQTHSGEKRIWEYRNTLRTQGVAAPIVRGMARDITEQRRVEEALRESESFRRMIFEAEPECVIVVAPDYALLDMNPAGLKMIEATTLEQVIGQSVLHLIAPEWRITFMGMHERVCRGESLVTEFEIVGLQGSRRWMESHSAPLLDKGSKVIAQLAITRDITERKRSEESLKLFRNLVDRSTDAIEVLEPGTLRFLDCNETAYRSLGYSREEFLSLSAFDIDPVVDHPMLDRLAESMDKSGCVIFESVHRRKDGSTFPVEINAKNIRLERDYRLAAVRDISERKAAEEALHEAEQKYRRIFENASEGIFQATADGRFTATNPALANIFGFDSPEEMISSCDDITGQLYADLSRREEFRLLMEQHGVVRDFESQALQKDGRKIWISLNVRAVRDDEDAIRYYEGTARDITVRKQAEAELIKQKETLQQIVDHIPVMINFTGPDGRIKLVNPEWQATLGWSLEEILSHDVDVFAECYPTPESRQEVMDFLAAATGNWHDFKTRTRDGGLIDTSWARAKLSDGTTIGIGQNVTARKEAELALRQAERKYREIFENAGEGIFQSTPDGKFLVANPALAHMHGFASPEELIQSRLDISLQVYVDPTRREDFIHLLEEQGAVRGFEHQVFRKDRSKIWISVNARAVHDEKGEIQYYEGTAQDITDRKRAEEALRESEERYRELFENAQDAIYVQDLSGVYISVNRAAEKLSGYDRTEIIGKHFGQFIAPEYLPLVCANFSKKSADTRQTAYEIEVVARDGQRVPVELSSALILKHGVPVAIQGIARDITDRKRAEQALRSYSRKLIDAQEAERQHIARELHDQIGQVLTAIKINLHTVGNSCETEESRFLVEQGVELVDGAMEQVRNLSFELRPSLLDNLGLAAALRWYSDQYTQRTGIRTKSASNMPEGQNRLKPELETACFRIVQEALTNVVRHANANNVFIELKQVDHKIILSVRDDGIGFREPTNGDSGATRLGLRGMLERALALGGTLKIESVPTQGTEIRASFPT